MHGRVKGPRRFLAAASRSDLGYSHTERPTLLSPSPKSREAPGRPARPYIGLNQMGILSTRQLREHRRYAIVAITALALLLPGTDPLITLLELIPMLVLFELSIVTAAVLERRRSR